MKKLLLSLLFLVAIISLAGCWNANNKSSNNENKDKNIKRVDTTVYIDDKAYNLPCSLKQFTDNGYEIAAQFEKDEVYQQANQTFPAIDVANNNMSQFQISAKTGNDLSKKDSNVTVDAITIQYSSLRQTAFKLSDSIKLNISTINDVITKYGNNYNLQVGDVTKPYDEMVVFNYKIDNKLLLFYFKENLLWKFQISIE